VGAAVARAASARLWAAHRPAKGGAARRRAQGCGGATKGRRGSARRREAGLYIHPNY